MMTVRPMPSPSPRPLMVLLEGYELAAPGEGRRSGTVALTKLAITRFVAFLQETRRSTDAAAISRNDVRAFSASLLSTPRFENHRFTPVQPGTLSRTSVNGYLRSLRAFFGWAVHEGHLYVANNDADVIKFFCQLS